ncbi:MAG: ribosome recycling factor [Rickettsiales bacterium]|jgi:ribosome recycling factor|nr:ribosome recycling factor [Rickettsiales bacterium]
MAVNEIVVNLKNSMDSTIVALKKDLGSINTGRATPSLLDPVSVELYGSMVSLNKVSNITVTDPTTLFVQVWDKNMVSKVEKAIREAGLGLNPQIEGAGMRVSVPRLTEERRKDLCKVTKKYGEDKKISIRNIRKCANEEVKKIAKTISEDQKKQIENDIQKTTDKYNLEVDRMVEEKNKLLLTY